MVAVVAVLVMDEVVVVAEKVSLVKVIMVVVAEGL